MSESKFTEGVWQFWGGRVATDIDNDGAVIIAERPSHSGGKRQAEVDANMRLMAASKDLLDACRKALYLLKGREHDGFLREVIAKATGEQL